MRQTVEPAQTSPPSLTLPPQPEQPTEIDAGSAEIDAGSAERDPAMADAAVATTETGSTTVEVTPAATATEPHVSVACAVCAFRDRSVQRRFFFALAEGISEPSFLAEFGASGGYCAWHARRVVRHGEGPRYAYAYLYGLGLALRRLTETPPARLGLCLICATERWAEDHALWAIASGEGSGEVAAGLTPDAPVCIEHGRALLLRAPWRDYDAARARLTDLLARLETTVSAGLITPTARLATLCGPDRHAPEPGVAIESTQAPERMPTVGADGTAWSRGVLSLEGLVVELRAGRCPACSAAKAASGTFLAYLDRAETRDELRDLPYLCADHLWSAAGTWPRAASRALDAGRERWAGRLAELPARGPAASWAKRLDLADRGTWRASTRPALTHREALDRALRADECRACRAAATAAERATALLDASLGEPAVAQAYAASVGLCLRHVDRGSARLSATGRAAVLHRATTANSTLRWELEESIRKSSWSVRYEPPGPETEAWRRAVAFGAGDAGLDLDGLPPDPGRPLPAI